MSQLLSTKAGEKHHLHVSRGDTVSIVPETFNKKAIVTRIYAKLTHDGLDAFYLLYMGVDDCYSLTAEVGKNKTLDSICVLVIGCNAKEHEILVKEGDMFAFIASPGHSFYIKYENDNTSFENNHNLTLCPENDITLNPANGRSYLVHALPVELGTDVTPTVVRIRAVQH